MRILIILLLLFTQGCLDKKSNPTVVDYTFIDYYTSKPIPNIKVLLTKRPFSLMGSFSTTIDTLTTNIDGKASYLFQNESGYFYNISPLHKSSYSIFEDSNLKTGKTNTNTLKLKLWNNLSLSLRNKSNKFKNVKVSFNTYNLGGQGYYSGKFIDTTLIFPESVPGENCHIWYYLYKNDTSTDPEVTHDTSFIVNTNETHFVEFEK